MTRTILLATDGSAAAMNAGDFAAETARCEGANVVVLGVLDPHAFGDSTEFSDTDVLLAQLKDAVATEAGRLADAGVTTEGRVWESSTDKVPKAIEQAAHDLGASLIVVGTHGHRGIDRALIGSVTEDLIRRSTIPVLAVPPTAKTERVTAGRETAGAKATT